MESNIFVYDLLSPDEGPLLLMPGDILVVRAFIGASIEEALGNSSDGFINFNITIPIEV
jgi:hypothetical protein